MFFTHHRESLLRHRQLPPVLFHKLRNSKPQIFIPDNTPTFIAVPTNFTSIPLMTKILPQTLNLHPLETHIFLELILPFVTLTDLFCGIRLVNKTLYRFPAVTANSDCVKAMIKTQYGNKFFKTFQHLPQTWNNWSLKHIAMGAFGRIYILHQNLRDREYVKFTTKHIVVILDKVLENGNAYLVKSVMQKVKYYFYVLFNKYQNIIQHCLCIYVCTNRLWMKLTGIQNY